MPPMFGVRFVSPIPPTLPTSVTSGKKKHPASVSEPISDKILIGWALIQVILDNHFFNQVSPLPVSLHRVLVCLNPPFPHSPCFYVEVVGCFRVCLTLITTELNNI